MVNVFLPQHQHQLRRRNNQLSRYESSGLQLTCLIMGVIWLIILIFVITLSNFQQLDWIEFNNISTTFNNYAGKKKMTPSLSLSHLPTCDAHCQIHRRQRLEQSDGMDLLSVKDMIASVQAKKQALLDRLGAPDQYGDLAGQLFYTRSDTQSLSSQLLEAVDAAANPSRERLRDKVQRKLLQVQLATIQQDNRPTADEASLRSSTTPSPPSVQVPYRFTQTRLVWATAGHGAAAGHGNLADESYTAILQKAAGPVFGAAGIELTSRNYGWAAATGRSAPELSLKSAPELALCLDSV